MVFLRVKWIIFVTVLFIIPAPNALAQTSDYPFDYPFYSFIHYDKNKLEMFANDSSFNNLFAKLDTLIFYGQGNLSILHIGASHVQADQLTGRFRERLFNFVPGLISNRGIVFPYGMAQSNHPYNYYSSFKGNWSTCRNVEIKKTCNLGLTGITAITEDSLAEINFYFRRQVYPSFRFDAITVLHATGDGYSEIDMVVPDSLLCSKETGNGYTTFRTAGQVDTLSFIISKADSTQKSFELYGFIAGNHKAQGLTYHAIGINGAQVSSFLRCNLFKEHLAFISPDLVLLSLGINDVQGKDFDAAQFERHYDSLISRIREVAPKASIVITSNSDSYYKRKYPNKHSIAARDVARRLSVKHPNTVLWDWFEIMGGLGSVKRWEEQNLVKRDLIHFTQEGYRLVGDLLFGAFISSFDDYLKNRNKKP